MPDAVRKIWRRRSRDERRTGMREIYKVSEYLLYQLDGPLSRLYEGRAVKKCKAAISL